MFGASDQNNHQTKADDSVANPISQPTDPSPIAVPVPQTSASVSDDVLMDIKRQALQKLTPLVNQLEQSAEEKFKTTMMLIQASDNPGLIKQAYEAANQIEDEKIKAQCLIDIINEINYFTNKDKS